jgi:hypothetical protein
MKAQDVKLCIHMGYGFYNMSSLSDVTLNIQKQLPFNAKVISNYPPYPYYRTAIKFSKKHIEFGLIYSFHTTGSRISSKDYSGEYKFDSKINSNSIGLILNGIHTDKSIFKVGVSLQAGMNFSGLKMNESLQVDKMTNTTVYNYTAQSFYLEPAINVIIPINRISLELNAGYFKEIIKSDYLQKRSSKNPIQVETNLIVSDIWDGARIGITISYSLWKKTATI